MTEPLAPLVPGARVLVTGAGITGRAVVAALDRLGVEAWVCDDSPTALTALSAGGTATISPAEAIAGISAFDLLVTSPGFAPTAPVPAAAAAAGLPIWGDVELAWRLDAAGRYGPPRTWLVVTGTNGKTTTTSMLHAMLVAAGRAAVLCGNIGEPVLDVLSRPADVLAVELSSFQLFWAPSLRPRAGAVLNVAEDHLDWHGSFAAYAAAKARALVGDVAVAGLDDPAAATLLADAPAPVRVGFRLGEPAPGELGVRSGILVDRAFGYVSGLADVSGLEDVSGLADVSGLEPASSGQDLAAVDSIPVAGPIGVLDALAAAALARSVDVPAAAIGAALAGFQLGAHRAAPVGEIAGVNYIDDSKATNPHAAEASIRAYPRVVWIAGGLLKGASVGDTVARVADRLAGVVLIGRDRAEVADALSRHAPDVPVISVVTREDAGVQEANGALVTDGTRFVDAAGPGLGRRVMAEAVAAAASLARPGDTVLLAPAGASFDQFSGYADRGDAFAAAVRAAAR